MYRLFFIVLTLLVLPAQMQAETVVRTADSVSITVDQIVENDLYVMSGAVAMSGTVAGDMYAVAGSITANGPIEADFSALAGRVHLSATVTDDVRIIAGDVVIAGPVLGDVFVIARSMKILSTATIAGDVFFFGNTADIAGSIDGGVMGSADALVLNGTVAEGVNVKIARSLSLGAQAVIEGDVQYQSLMEIARSPDATIGGSVLRSSGTGEQDVGIDIRFFLIPFLMMLFGSLLLYLIARRHIEQLVSDVCKNPQQTGFIGLGSLVGVSVLVVVLIVTVLGLLFGLGLFSVLAALLLLSYVVAPIVYGAVLSRLVSKKLVVNSLTILIGVSVWQLVLLVPFFGSILAFGTVMIVFGTIVLRIWNVAT